MFNHLQIVDTDKIKENHQSGDYCFWETFDTN